MEASNAAGAAGRRLPWRVGLLLLLAVVAVVVLALHGPIAQPAGYHAFADRVPRLGVPNGWNVLSNLAFVVVGVVGLRQLRRGTAVTAALPALLPAYRAFFVGALLIGAGSGWYHLAPDNARLVWDRLPMTIAFMALVAIVLGEHIDERIGRRTLWPLIALGVGSVLFWWLGERGGVGDLRPYVLVQFLPMLLLPLVLLLYRSCVGSAGALWALIGLYALAKAFEFGDAVVLALAGISGHSLKHLAAAAAMAMLLVALRRRPSPAAGPRTRTVA